MVTRKPNVPRGGADAPKTVTTATGTNVSPRDIVAFIASKADLFQKSDRLDHLPVTPA